MAHLVCQLSIYTSFPVIWNTVAKNRHFYVPRPSFFVCPGDAPAAITQNVAWMKKNSVLAKPLAACTHLSWKVSQLFELQVQKIAVFMYRSPYFCFSLETPQRLSRNMLHGWKDNNIQCLSNPLQHVPIYLQQFPSYLNRKCKKSQFSRTSAHIFVSPGDAPAIIMQYVAWMERQFNAC